MNSIKVKVLADTLMNKHLPAEMYLAWNFAFSNAKTQVGLCSHRRRTIYVSKHFARLNDLEVIEQTLLHEIAHALVGSGHGHDRVWSAKARSIGFTGGRLNTTAKSPEHKWYLVMKGCNNIHARYHRKPKWFNLVAQISLKGRKAETLGNLEMILHSELIRRGGEV